MKERLLLLAITLFGLVTIPTSAQKRTVDPRPQPPLRVEDLPPFRSIEEFMRDRPTENPLRRMVSRGIVTPTTLPSPITMPINGLKSIPSPMGAAVRIERSENGAARWIDGPLGTMALPTGIAGSSSSQALAAGALGIIERYRPELGIIEPASELQLISSSRDELGSHHIRFQQIYRGIPIWGRDLYLHTDADNQAYLLNGSTVPTPAAISTVPTIASSTAFETVVADLSAKQRWAPLPEEIYTMLDMEKPRTTLVIYPESDRSLRLAYEVVLHPNLLERYTYIVDATSGTILNRIAMHCSMVNHDHDDLPAADRYRLATKASADSPLQSSTTSGQFFNARAADLGNVQQNFRVYQHTDNLFYSLWDLSNFNPAASALPGEMAGGAMVVSAGNRDFNENVQLAHVHSTSNNWTDRSAVSASMNMSTAFEYYKRTFGRRAIDNNDQSMISIVHVTMGGESMGNAFWNGRIMAYGDGDANFKGFAGSQDVGGHEMTHGVVETTANLIYQNQSGALNESFADVFGIMIDRDDFLLGEDIMMPGRGIALRDLSNPANPDLIGPQPGHMNQFRNMPLDQDNGGVHVNSGIPNHAAYLMIQAIGREKTEQIYYRALSNYLVRDSKFIDARNAIERAAKDLFGDGSEAAAARASFDAVGITGGAGSNPGDNDLPPMSGGIALIAFTTANGTIGIVNPQTGEPSFFDDPRTMARISIGSDGSEFRSQLSTPANGRRIYFINPDGELSAVDVQTGQVFGSDVSIANPGDLWNVAVSPDEQYVALVSHYSDDAHIYIYDLNESLFPIPLRPETSQNGLQVETIQFPDAISWSPNIRDRRIAFDALNRVDIAGGGSTAYWSLYEINFSAQRIYGLVPAQPMSINIGNVTYSRLDPDVIAFNVIDSRGVYDVSLADFASRQFVGLGLSDPGSPVTDAQRPTFAPDNSALAFVSPLNNMMMYLEFSTGQFSAQVFPGPIYNPYWFLFGGVSSVDGASTAEAAGLTLRSLPNPASGSTMIEYRLPAAANARLEVIDLYGRSLATLIDGALPAGAGSVRFDAGSLLPGSYLLRLTAGGRVEMAKIVILR